MTKADAGSTARAFMLPGRLRHPPVTSRPSVDRLHMCSEHGYAVLLPISECPQSSLASDTWHTLHFFFFPTVTINGADVELHSFLVFTSFRFPYYSMPSATHKLTYLIYIKFQFQFWCSSYTEFKALLPQN